MLRTLTAALAVSCFLPTLAHAQVMRPDETARSGFELVVREVDKRRSRLEQDDCAAYAFVDEFLRGQFDFRYASRRILNRNWPEQDPALQKRFVEAFYGALVGKYAWVLPHLNEQTLSFDMLERDPPFNQQTVTGAATLDDGTTVKIKLRMFLSGDSWKIIDVRAESYSYVDGFRDKYLGVIYESSLEALIASLESEAADSRGDCGL